MYAIRSYYVTNKKKRLGDLLVEVGIITNEQLMQALELQKSMGKKLGEVLVHENYVSEEQIIEVLEFQLGIAHVVLEHIDIDSEATKLISESLAKSVITSYSIHYTKLYEKNFPKNI